MPKKNKSAARAFLPAFFFLGVILGAIFSAALLEKPQQLILSHGVVVRKEMGMVGVDAVTGEGKVGVVWVELREGSGETLFAVPPFENEDTQKAVISARAAVVALVGKSFDSVDFAIGLENLGLTTSIAGPSIGASVALLMLAAVREAENAKHSRVEDIVISAKIDSTGRLGAVGNLKEKYEAVRASGRFTAFIVAETQPVNFQPSRDLPLLPARNLKFLAELALR